MTTLWFVFLSAMVMVMASERVYWYWAANPNKPCFDVLWWWVLGLWYMLPTLAGLWALGWAQATRWQQVVLAGGVYAFVTEGVITPVMYEGGPFDPFMPAMFLGWHGMFAMCGFWFLARWLIAKRRSGKLATIACLGGVVFGLWSTTSWLPENRPEVEAVEQEGWSTAVLGMGEFALYAMTVGVVLVVTHWLLSRAWPSEFRPRIGLTAFVFGVNGLLFIPMVIAIPWAPLKFGVCIATTLWALHRSRRGNEGQTIFAQLTGPASLFDVAPLMLLPLTAAATYSAVLAANPPEEFIRTFVYFGLVWVQVLVGGIAFVWAVVTSFRN